MFSSPFSWSLDAWLVVFQFISAAALAITIVIGIVLSKRTTSAIKVAERTLLEVQKEQEPRRITDKQRSQISDALFETGREFARTGVWQTPLSPYPVQVKYADKNTEAAAFAREIFWTLRMSPFPVPKEVEPVDLAPWVAETGRSAGYGVWIATGRESPEVKALMEAFEAANIQTKEMFLRAIKDGTIYVVIGEKPNPRFEAELEREQNEWQKKAAERAAEDRKRIEASKQAPKQ